MKEEEHPRFSAQCHQSVEGRTCTTRLCQSTAVQTSARSTQAQHSRDNDGSVGDWHSLDRHEDIRVNLADHAANTTCPSLASP